MNIPEVFFQPAEVPACVVVFAETLAARSAAGCHGVRHRAPRPGSVAQAVGDHAPGWNEDTIRIKQLKLTVETRTARVQRVGF